MKHYAHHTFPPTSSSDNSDSEDLYGGFETDDLHPSDSELISHPSDNEEHTRSLSSSPLPTFSAFRSTGSARAGIDSGRDTDDEDQALPSFSLSSQDFDQHPPSQRNQSGRVQDDFFLVEPSDLEPSSRPQSSLSHHSDLERPEDPMHFIYPSMVLSPLSNDLLHGGESQDQIVDKGSLLKEDSSHIPPTHDIPVTVDSSLETILGESSTQTRQCSLNREFHRVHSEGKETENTQEKVDDNEEASFQVSNVDTVHVFKSLSPCLERNTNQSAQRKTLSESKPLPDSNTLQPAEEVAPVKGLKVSKSKSPTTTKSTLDPISQDRQARVLTSPKSIPINTSWSFINIITCCFGFLLMLLLAGYLSAEYYNRSVYPAHVVVSEISYVEDHRVAVVHLSVYTYKLKRETRCNRPPGFHVRVLGDKIPWSLEEAPAQSRELFGEPIVDCTWGGWCIIYVPSLVRRGKNGSSPFLCSDSSYYLHIWFANGTRTSDAPPEIFTSLEEGKSKPLECLSRTFASLGGGQSTPDDIADDSYLAYWKLQFQELAEEAKAVVHNSYNLSLSWGNMKRHLIQPAVAEFQNLVKVAFIYYQHSTHTMAKWVDRLIRTDDAVQKSPVTALTRAQSNAKKIRDHVSMKFWQVTDQVRGIPVVRSKRQVLGSMEHQVRILKDTLENQWNKLSSNGIVGKVDELLVEVENNLESLMKSKGGVRPEEIRRKAERLVKEAETKLAPIFNSRFIHKINQNLQHSVDQLKKSSTGNKAIREAQGLKKDAKRLWKDLQKQLHVLG
ncbi:hypothetical protein BGZ49_003577 [Haplosporangium sp. Z 27]|nr:hypothetical protein BGZ49_003577 [Haplosporangium sp. Z 27]